jgi:hypothetical protein
MSLNISNILQENILNHHIIFLKYHSFFVFMHGKVYKKGDVTMHFWCSLKHLDPLLYSTKDIYDSIMEF